MPPARIATVAAALLALPAALLAQRATPSGVGAEIYFAHNTGFPTPRMLAGAALTMGAGPIVLRGSGALNRVTDAFEQTETPYTLDADLMLNSGALGQMAGILLGGFAPVGFVGIGTQGIYRAEGERPTMPNLSYGGGASLHLFEGIRVGAEARWRRPFGDVANVPAGFGAGREVKLGIAFGFGAGSGLGAARSGSTTSRGGSSSSGTRFPSAPASASARAVLGTADDYLGVPYVWGGETPRGFDCSGFTQYVFAKHGVRLPRVSRQQAQVGQSVATSAGALRAGDLMFFAFADGRTVDHVAIYAGDGRMIHSSSSGDGVNFDDLSTRRGQHYLDNMVAARRVLSEGQAQSMVRTLDDVYKASLPYDPPDTAPRRVPR